MVGKIQSELGVLPSEAITKAILNGKYIALEETNAGVKEVLQYLQL